MPTSWTAGAPVIDCAEVETLSEFRSSVRDVRDGEGNLATGAIEDDLELLCSSLCVSASVGGSGCVTTDGEADAARSCSSRLAPVTGDGEDFAKVDNAGFPGCANGNVDGKVGCCPGYGNVALLKRRPLPGQQRQWNEMTTTT